MRFVVDASVAIRWLIVGEDADVVREKARGGQDLHEPRVGEAPPPKDLVRTSVARFAALWRGRRCRAAGGTARRSRGMAVVATGRFVDGADGVARFAVNEGGNEHEVAARKRRRRSNALR